MDIDIEDRVNISEEHYAYWQRRLQVRQSAQRISSFEEDKPHDVLGLHKEEDGSAILRAHIPYAKRAWVRTSEGLVLLNKLLDSTVYEGTIGTKNTLPHEINFSVDEQTLLESFEKRRRELINQNIWLTDNELNALLKREFATLVEQTPLVQYFSDSYSFPPDITNDDNWFWGQGTHLKAYERFGARLRTINGISGVNFVVWAPNADAISVIGKFNHWKAGTHPMSRIGSSGLWGLFIPGLKEGDLYKYAVKRNNKITDRTDPFGLQTEMRPNCASIITDLDKYQWQDSEWMEKRKSYDPLSSPISFYEVHLGSWMRNYERNYRGDFLNYRELAKLIVAHAKKRGYTHIQLLPITEHLLDKSWGYQCTGYFAPTSRHGKPEDFMYFVDYCHQNNIGVFLDWVPGHFPKDTCALNMFDGTQQFAYSDPRIGEHSDWGTMVFNYSNAQVKDFLLSSALFWPDKYHIDGLRVDGVASMIYRDYSRRDKGRPWIPNHLGGNEHFEAMDFLRELNDKVKEHCPGAFTIAEESTTRSDVTAKPYSKGLGFTMKWNMGWMNDTLKFFREDPINRRWHLDKLTHTFDYAFDEMHVLPISHDEVVYGKKSLLEKMPGDQWQKFANLRLFLAYMFSFPGKKLSFMTNDIAQVGEWDFDSSLDWDRVESYKSHMQIGELVTDLNRLYRENKAMHELDLSQDGFQWSFYDRQHTVIGFNRTSKSRDKTVAICCNMTPIVIEDCFFPVPKEGTYREILNTDDECYGGSNVKNPGDLISSTGKYWNYRYDIKLKLPPLALTAYELVS